jgi:hypothetical protein
MENTLKSSLPDTLNVLPLANTNLPAPSLPLQSGESTTTSLLAKLYEKKLYVL